MNHISDVFFGIVIGIMIGIAIMSGIAVAYFEILELQDQCESKLPRNEKCVMKFVHAAGETK